MLLSGLDSKKYQSILRFKRSLKESPELLATPILHKNLASSNREIDGYGETVVKQLQVKPINFSQKQIDEIVCLYQSGKSPYKIAMDFGCCEFTIRKVLKQQNIEIVKCRAQAKVDAQTAIMMYSEGHTLVEISEHFDVSRYTVAKVLRSYNVELRKRRDYINK